MDDVVDLVRNLVSQGWYIDDFKGKPEPVDPPAPPQRPAPRTRYQRGSEEFRVAWERGLVEPPPPLTVATEQQVSQTEEFLQVPLPPLLRRLYLEIGNGGFGPRTGIPGVRGGFVTPEGDLPTMNRGIHYQGTPDSPVDGDFPELVTFFNWGGTAWSCIDCRTPDGEMYLFEDMELEPAKMTLEEWFRRWIDHRIKKGLPA